MKMKRGLKLLALVGVLSLVIAACGGGEGGDTTTTAGEAETTTSAAGGDTTTSAAGETTTAPAEGLGTIEVAPGDPIKIASLQSISGADGQPRAPTRCGRSRSPSPTRPRSLVIPSSSPSTRTTAVDSEGGQTGSTRIIADPQVVAVIGTSCSGAGVPASNVVTSAGRVLISGSNTSPALTSDLAGNEAPEYHDGYFRTAHNDAIQGAAAAKFVFEELGLTKVATINDGDPYTQGLTSAFEGPFQDLGGEIVLSTAVTADQTDMRSGADRGRSRRSGAGLLPDLPAGR